MNLFTVPCRQRKGRRKAELLQELFEVVDRGNGLVWSRVVGRKMCKEGCEERKSWGLECSEDVEADGMV